MSLWAGPVERFVPNSVGAKNDRWSRITQASLHDSIPYGARITVEFHKLRLISIVDESLTCKLNAVDLYAVICNVVFKLLLRLKFMPDLLAVIYIQKKNISLLKYRPLKTCTKFITVLLIIEVGPRS